jgi:hypothetical protein
MFIPRMNIFSVNIYSWHNLKHSISFHDIDIYSVSSVIHLIKNAYNLNVNNLLILK